MVYAISVGYLDHGLLKELYHCGIVANFALVKDGISTREIDGLEGYRREGDGKAFENFIEDLKLENGLDNVFQNRRVKSLLAYCFEKINGKGAPRGISYNEMTDFEMLFIFSFNAVAFKELESRKGDGEEFFLKIEESICEEFAPSRLRRLVEASFEG